MTEEEFRSELLAAAASRAETHATGLREAFVAEVLDRLREAGEIPDAEACPETLTGQRSRRLEIDAFAFDDADDSLHLFVAIRDGGPDMPAKITLSEARDQGFSRLLGVFDQAREGWLTANIEESRPLWALARRIQMEGKPAALRLNVVTDRMVSERLREIPPDQTREGVPLTFQIWDVSRLKRIHEAQNVRDDLFVDFSALPGGGLAILPAAVGIGDYDAYLAVVPGETLADIYIRHGSRLLEGNVRTFLGRRGNINKGIASTLTKEPARFFAYNNGIAATASAVTTVEGPGRTLVLSGATDLQIVNGAQTTASLAAMQREGKLPESSVFVPMKLSVVKPDIAVELIPRISRFSNSQNSVRASDFFANHPFHQRMEGISRRILAPAVGGSQVQTHWYYERARGQHLNDQAGMTATKREQFLRRNPRNQVITKTDLAKVENCFDLLPDIACKGAEKSFTQFAERITREWMDERKRSLYSDDWYRGAAARTILFRTTEMLVSKASWYEGGYRAQIVAYTTARLSALATECSGGGRLDYLKIWAMQAAGDVLERQLLAIAEVMTVILRSPPQAGQNISEWAKQQACRKNAMETAVPLEPALQSFLLALSDAHAADRTQLDDQRVADGLAAVTAVVALGASAWQQIRSFAREKRLLIQGDESVLAIACAIPHRVPEDWQAGRLLLIKQRCESAGHETLAS
ncbi:Abortive phage infection protein [uncultured Defluviicoccus sp.]|uniref:Abortive phage infection protein n=1 Tax=metagenome TaxID=256318 RepID=A0A380TGH3_9ZZZZ|nr:Abortive phage infection protein [uncultured Defluviicoccus sp.]